MKSNDISELKNIGSSILEYEGPDDYDNLETDDLEVDNLEEVDTLEEVDNLEANGSTGSEQTKVSNQTTIALETVPILDSIIPQTISEPILEKSTKEILETGTDSVTESFTPSVAPVAQLFTSIWYVIVLLYLELCLSLSCFQALSSYVYILHSSIAVGLIIYAFVNIKKKKRKTNHLISVIITALLSFVYLSEVLYFKMFDTFYGISSFANITNITQYWTTLLTVLQDNIIILLMILPIFIVLLRRHRTINYNPKTRTTLGAIGLIIYVAMSVLLNTGFLLNTEDINKFQSNTYEPNESIERFGCIISLQSDIIHLLSDITF